MLLQTVMHVGEMEMRNAFSYQRTDI